MKDEGYFSKVCLCRPILESFPTLEIKVVLPFLV